MIFKHFHDTKFTKIFLNSVFYTFFKYIYITYVYMHLFLYKYILYIYALLKELSLFCIVDSLLLIDFGICRTTYRG